MNLSALSTVQVAIIVAIAVLLVASIAILFSIRKRNTKRLRTQFGGAEYNRAVKEGGSRQKAEALLDKRADRVEGFHIQPLSPADRARFLDSWRHVQARFVDGPGASSGGSRSSVARCNVNARLSGGATLNNVRRISPSIIHRFSIITVSLTKLPFVIPRDRPARKSCGKP